MVLFLRTAVMLLTLIGLPTAWVYYGPLPTGAQRVVDRFVEVAKQAVGWQEQQASTTHPWNLKAAPRFDDILPTNPDYVPVIQTGRTLEPIALASATLPASEKSRFDASNELAAQCEPELSVLRSLGAANYALEHWGDDGTMYRFRCELPLGEDINFTRHFEAVAAQPISAIQQVVGEVSAWQNARNDAGALSVQWR
jgi:hypothetical protein